MEYRVIDNRYPIVIDNLIDEARNTQLSIIINRKYVNFCENFPLSSVFDFH